MTNTDSMTSTAAPGMGGENWRANFLPRNAPLVGREYGAVALMTPSVLSGRMTKDPAAAAPGGGLRTFEGEGGLGRAAIGGCGGEYGGLGCTGGATAMHDRLTVPGDTAIESMKAIDAPAVSENVIFEPYWMFVAHALAGMKLHTLPEGTDDA